MQVMDRRSRCFALKAEGGHATVFTTSVRVDAPPISRGVAIYAATGAGIANVTDRYQVTPSVSNPAVLFIDPTPHVELRAATEWQ